VETRLPDVPRIVREIFSSTGLLSGRKGFEFRPQQQDMAVAVARALTESGHVAVEAGTGVGKSYAYLIPAALHALAAKKRAIVSTHTINLQEQLIDKDIPYVAKVLKEFKDAPFGHGISFKAVLVKGRANYLCPRRLQRALRDAAKIIVSTEYAELLRPPTGRDAPTTAACRFGFAARPESLGGSLFGARHLHFKILRGTRDKMFLPGSATAHARRGPAGRESSFVIHRTGDSRRDQRRRGRG